jgi:hypothetical protein
MVFQFTLPQHNMIGLQWHEWSVCAARESWCAGPYRRSGWLVVREKMDRTQQLQADTAAPALYLRTAHSWHNTVRLCGLQ